MPDEAFVLLWRFWAWTYICLKLSIT